VARTFVRRLEALDPTQLEAMYAEMTAQAAEVVRDSAGGGGVTIVRSVDARYVGQGYELTVPVPAGALDAAALARIRSAFDEIYAARYGYAQPNEPVEVVTWKLSAIGGAPRIVLPKTATGPVSGGLKGRRRAYFPEAGGWVDCPIYDRYKLAAGMQLAGPAIVEERESTSVLPPGAVATVDEYANLIVEVGAR
jgi:N-methylhydantoinase A/oxoprolinase/acetone carboxylase beta subunit